MFTSVVVPLDGSALGMRALPVALALARSSEAGVHLVHVHDPIEFSGGGMAYDARALDAFRQEMRTDLTALAARLAGEASLPVDAEFLDGPVVPTLQGYLAERRPGLVVMMTHGRGGLSRAWLGSVADGLVRHASVPLLLVRSPADGSGDPGDLAEPRVRRVLVPLDGSAMAEEALDHVVSLGAPDDMVYTLLTVLVPLPGHPYPDAEGPTARADIERRREAALAYLDRAAEELRQTGARVETRVVVHDRPAERILDAADEHHVDAIALSTHGRGAVSRLVHGSVADKVVRGATVPVLVCRPEHVGVTSAEPERGASTLASLR